MYSGSTPPSMYVVSLIFFAEGPTFRVSIKIPLNCNYEPSWLHHMAGPKTPNSCTCIVGSHDGKP